MKKYLLLCIYCLFALMGNAQESLPDSIRQQIEKELKKKEKAERNFHYNILGGPSYTPDFGVLVGGSALMTFRMNPKDTTMRRSVIPAAIAFMFKGGLNLVVKPQLFFKNDRFRIFGQFSFKNTQENFYGVGYSTNKNYVRSDTTSQYRYSGIQINPWFLFRLGESNFFAGPQIDITYDHIMDPAKYLVEHPDYKHAGGTANGYENFSSGIGFLLTYDTRDVPANPYKGLYFDLRGLMYEKFLGSNSSFYRLELDYRQYKTVGKRKVLAWTVQSKHSFGHNIPLNKYVLSGTPLRLARVLHGTISRQILTRGTGRIPTDVQYGPKQLDKENPQSPGLCGLGRMWFHGTHTGQN